MSAIGVTTDIASVKMHRHARHFVTGKLFSYACFDGTRGLARVNPDVSEVSRNFHRLGLLVAGIIVTVGLLLMLKDALGLRLGGFDSS